MRIVAGQFRGRRIDAPAGEGTRPTTDRVRESLMSAVYSARGPFDDAAVLDAFAGSGALGLEALSRGASRCTFLDTARKARAVVSRNAGRLGLSHECYRVLSLDAFAASAGRRLPGAPVDLVFLDPPYARSAHDVCALISALADGGQLSDGCLCVYEHATGTMPPDDCDVSEGSLRLVFARRYGDTCVSMYRYRLKGAS